MPSFEHQGFIELFPHRPELAAELLRDVLRIELPAYTEACVESADLTDIKPAERRADLVVLLALGKPVLGIVVEVQLQPDPDKRRRWPAYVVGLHDRLDCAACVLVVAPSESTARRCREPIELGPGNVFRPLVVGPASVPIVDDVALAERDPELAVLSVMAHGHEAHAEALGRTALLAIQRLTDDRHALYSDLVLAAVSKAVRTALEELMASGNYEFQSDFVKKFLAKGRAEALLSMLDARGLRLRRGPSSHPGVHRRHAA
jgi:hypothetical protein